MERKIGKRTRLILYVMIGCQMVAWAWFFSNGGQLSDKHFLVFSGAMLLGQGATATEGFMTRAWGVLAGQVWFFVFTLYGGIVRLMSM